MNNEIICIKDVVMLTTGELAFTKGKKYKANTERMYVQAINNNDEIHELDRINSQDGWFKEHFEIVE